MLTLGLRYSFGIILPIVGTFFLAFSILEDHTLLHEELNTFILDWEVSQNLLPQFKVLINDYRSFFEDLSLWLTQVEVNLKNLTKDAVERMTAELVEEMYRRAYRQYYLRPKPILRRLGHWRGDAYYARKPVGCQDLFVLKP